MIVGFLAMGVAGALGEKRGISKSLLLVGVGLFALAFMLVDFSLIAAFIAYQHATLIFIIAVVVFFAGFNLHEPIMQSVASKFARANERGTALGVFNAFGYAGSFLGGVLSGLAWRYFDLLHLIIAVFVLSCVWFVLLCFLKSPSDFKNLYLPLDTSFDNANTDFDSTSASFESTLSSHKGIIEIYTNSTQLVIKYDSKIIDEKALKSLLKLD